MSAELSDGLFDAAFKLRAECERLRAENKALQDKLAVVDGLLPAVDMLLRCVLNERYADSQTVLAAERLRQLREALP